MSDRGYNRHPARGPRTGAGGERGHLLLGLMLLVTVMSILSGVGFQHWSIIQQREKEAQLIFIQKQYAMALLEYQNERGGPPTELKMLEERGSRNQRFIRRLWLDPMTRDEDGEEEGLDRWCILQAGPNNVPVSSCPQPDEEGEDPGRFRIGPDVQPLAPTAGAGLPIIGVASRSREKSYRLWNDRDVYGDWIYTIQDIQKEGTQFMAIQ